MAILRGTSVKQELLQRMHKGARVAILLSGTGSNARRILEERSRYPKLEFVGIVSNREESGAQLIAQQFDLSVLIAKRFDEIAAKLREWDVGVLLYAGFMRISPSWFCQEFPGLNIHPADLTIQKDGQPKYVGLGAVKHAIEAGEDYLASTIHVVEEGVDEGAIIAVSEPLPKREWEGLQIDEVHALLKEQREHSFYPDCLESLCSFSETRSILLSTSDST